MYYLLHVTQTELTMGYARRSVSLLGATGNIGVQTLDVLRSERERFELVSVAGGDQLSELAAIVHEFGVKSVAVKSERASRRPLRSPRRGRGDPGRR